MNSDGGEDWPAAALQPAGDAFRQRFARLIHPLTLDCPFAGGWRVAHLGAERGRVAVELRHEFHPAFLVEIVPRGTAPHFRRSRHYDIRTVAREITTNQLAALTMLAQAITTNDTDRAPRDLWHAALDQAERGSKVDARAAVEAALRTSATGRREEALAARMLLLAGDFAGAERLLERAETNPAIPDARQIRLVARAYLDATLGDFSSAMAALDQLTDVNRALPVLFVALDLAARVEAPELALRWAEAIAVHPSAHADHALRSAGLLLRAGAEDAAVATLKEALRGTGMDRGRAAHVLLACRACDAAAEVSRALIADGGRGAGDAHLILATIHLWRGEAAEAERHARQALERGADAGGPRRVIAAAAVLERRRDGLAVLDGLLEHAPADAEARVWRIEALLHAAQPEAALAEARRAGDATSDHSSYVALRLLEAIAKLRLGRRPEADLLLTRGVAALCGPQAGERVRKFVRDVGAGRDLAMSAEDQSANDEPAAIETILLNAVMALGGNRTHRTPTRLEGGSLAPLRVAPPPRSEVKAALHSVRIGGFAEAHSQLTVLIGRYPGWPHPWFYRAELLMWVGLLDDARADLETALGLDVADPEIERGHWPAIGLAGIHVLQGRPHEALEMLDRAARRFDGPPAQPYHAWRGETLRALGRLDEARAELERVCPPRGLRLGSCITLGLVCRDLGDRQRPAEVLAQLIEQGPALMIDVTRGTSNERIRSALEPDGLDGLTDNDRRELLEQAQAAMRGNRSASCVTFVDSSGRLRVIPPGGIYHCVDRPDEIAALRAELQTDAPGRRPPAVPSTGSNRPNRRL